MHEKLKSAFHSAAGRQKGFAGFAARVATVQRERERVATVAGVARVDFDLAKVHKTFMKENEMKIPQSQRAK